MNVSDSILVTVAMAIYRPNIEWLKEELSSIAAQTYKHFQVYAWNDDPNDEYDYDFLFSQYLKDIPFRIYHGSQNLGSNKVFEKLTRLAKTLYIAYCDQDDVWLPEKLSVLLHLFDDENVTLACSDMYVIDENSKVVSNSITKIRPRQILYSGPDMIAHLLAKNFITGCTMMMKTEIARKAIPFPRFFFHDWWLASFAALLGKIKISDRPLMNYRVYEGNQSKPLAKIHSKAEYLEKYIIPYRQFIELVSRYFAGDKRLQPYKRWSEVRISYFQRPTWKNASYLWKRKDWAPSTTKLELLLPFIPSFIFLLFLRKIQSSQ